MEQIVYFLLNTDTFAEHIGEHNVMAQRIEATNLGTTYVYDLYAGE